MIPKAGGYLTCPYCGNRKLLHVTDQTEAHRLPVWCRKCRRELIIEIWRGQSFISQSPADP